MKILKDEDYKRLLEFEKMAHRIFQAHRWFSGLDPIFKPMWDYILGAEEYWTYEGGRIGMMINGTISDVRDEVRKRIKSELDKGNL